MKPRVLITGCGGPAAIGFTKSLQKTNAYTFVGTDSNINSMPFSPIHEKYLVPKATDPSYIENINNIVSDEKVNFLHAQPDPEVLVISKERKRLCVPTFLPSHKTVEICQDKYKSFLEWERAGIEMPQTHFLHTLKDLETAFNELPKPFWIRATSGAGGRGSLIVDNIDKARVWIDYWKGWGSFMASELLPNRLLTWQSIWKDGELVCAQSRERLSWAMGNATASGVSGMTGVGKTISRKDLDTIAEKAIFAIDKKPNGIFGVDLKENAKGIPCPTEINIGRFFTTIQFFTELGLNMPDIYVKLALGDKIPKIKKRYNMLPDDYYWLRSADSEPILLHQNDFNSICKNKIDARKLLVPDSTVKYHV